MENKKVIWTDKKRPLFGLPLSFTRYILYEDKLILNSGFLFRRQEEVKLYRMVDFSVTQSLFQRMFGVGNVNISSSDNMQGEFSLLDIKKPFEVKEILSDAVEVERGSKNIGMNEFLR